MCNCGKNNRKIGPRRNAHFDRGARNPDIRESKDNTLTDAEVEALQAALATPEPTPVLVAENTN